MSLTGAQCQTLEASCQELKQRLDEFTDVLKIKPEDVQLSEQKLGAGAYAGDTYLVFATFRTNHKWH